MNETLETLVDDILAVVFDDRGPDTPASIAAAELAARIMNKKTGRSDLVRSVAQLILAINAELREREALKREAEARAVLERCARDPRSVAGSATTRSAAPSRPAKQPVPVGRRWRINPLLDQMLTGQPAATSNLMGDPAPGRSALDQRQGGTQ
ncbi:hypothetical protein [Stappia sp.]|uniref:hypothetical protein n=1 Tax=Stappia sp. TaxID=1870903 RepID=UPI003A98EBD1